MMYSFDTFGARRHRAAAAAAHRSARLHTAAGQWLSYEVPLQPDCSTVLLNSSGDDFRSGACRLDQRDWSFGSRDGDPRPRRQQLRVCCDVRCGLRSSARDRPQCAVVRPAVMRGGASMAPRASRCASDAGRIGHERGHVGAAIAHPPARSGCRADRCNERSARKYVETRVLAGARARRAGFGTCAACSTGSATTTCCGTKCSRSASVPSRRRVELRICPQHASDEVRAEAIFAGADDDPQAEASSATHSPTTIGRGAQEACSPFRNCRPSAQCQRFAPVKGKNAAHDVRKSPVSGWPRSTTTPCCRIRALLDPQRAELAGTRGGPPPRVGKWSCGSPRFP